MKKLELRASTLQQFAALGSLILMMILFSILSPYFLNFDNLITVIKQTSVVGIIAIGVTLVIVTGGIDLSLGSVVALSGVVAGFALAKGASNFVGILIGALIGLLCGLISGVIVAYLELPAFIATLGMMMSARGMSLVLTQGRPVYIPNNKTFNLIHNYNLFKYIPLPVIYFAVIALLTHFLLKRTSTGRYLFATGSNEEAARLSGINVRLVKLFSYGFCGFMCGLSGVILLARLNSAQPAIGSGYELDAIAAVVIGGTSLSGGVGQISGTIIGVLIMSTMKNGLNLMHVSQFWQQVIIGGVVILAVYIDIKRREAQRL
ncbi:MAG: Ribose transport system permease protein RbsC [Spirochaetes bacterium ADurb.Bin315]|jgi:ribose transport system permease protein|nr:ABC transporter permease [Spirochaetota bacterium]OQA44403.1 MAG: Ribose transport system permease protein RbsC [Spirochaetes bacterium ADurb.Bin315]HOE88951.1 ABC transporter permease [Sphaerochaeta sp.]HOR80342.1 ABC transporter permease [Sphaerochaeta sp.]HPB42330.1 ABC transporter permease [Sphaerochaeta sp.]